MSLATDPNTRTVSYGLAPGALDDDIDVQSEEMLVNMGPQHPSTHGVLRIVLRTDGEMVLEDFHQVRVKSNQAPRSIVLRAKEKCVFL